MAGIRLSPTQELRAAAVLLSVALGGLTGCAQPPAAAKSTEIVPDYNAETGRLERINYDRNTDGKPDAWLFMSGTLAERAELDDNHDGAVDRWEHYDSVAPAPGADALPRGTLVRAEQSTRFDGKVSRWEWYERGELARVEEDTSGDARPDKWESWSAGSLQSVALDTTNDGTPDRQIVYAADGSAPRLLVDTDGDGSFEPASIP